jgi:hypothetical protein
MRRGDLRDCAHVPPCCCLLDWSDICNESKHTIHNARGAASYRFVPLSVETHGLLGQLLMDLLGKAHEVEEAGSEATFSKATFVANALHELCVALCI